MLLTGIGLGLQQIVNALNSSIILLSERSIEVGDVLEIDTDIVIIERIGLRIFKAMNRAVISMILLFFLLPIRNIIN